MRFDEVDLGGDKTMARLVKAELNKRNAVIEECALVIEPDNQCLADRIRKLKTTSVCV